MDNKLIIKNVGPIKDIEIEVKQITVLIGPQGSGKSTIAKLLSILKDADILPSFDYANKFAPKNTIFEKYSIQNYINKDSVIEFYANNYTIKYIGNNEFDIILSTAMQNHIYEIAHINNIELIEKYNNIEHENSYESIKGYWKMKREQFKNNHGYFYPNPVLHPIFNFYIEVLEREILFPYFYIPAERILIPTLSTSIWNLTNSQTNLPKNITTFGSLFERAKENLKEITISILGIKYLNSNNTDYVIINRKKILLSESASGFQSIIPLFIVTEYLKKYNINFVVEEPELNLYPSTQKTLIQYLVTIKRAMILTTHSPYILSVLNNLIFAYKAYQLNSNNYKKLNKIIPQKSWINQDNIGAYFVDNGKCSTIINNDIGLISENELDGISIDIAQEREKILTIYRKESRDKKP